MNILLITENMSQLMGGESAESLIFFRYFRERKINVQAVCHARCEQELKEILSDEEIARITFVDDSFLQENIWNLFEKAPERFRSLIIGQIIHLLTQIRIRNIALQKIQEDSSIDLIFEPVPITPKGLSFMYDMGVPVVIGPLSGGLSFPPAFEFMDSVVDRLGIKFGRLISDTANKIVPGKINADALIVANEKTVTALPTGYTGKVFQVFESGVDLKVWKPKLKETDTSDGDKPVRFIFSGRFVDWKGGEYLLRAFARVAKETNSILDMAGDGELSQSWQALAKELGIEKQVIFHGWMIREQCAELLKSADVFVMPSLREAGGNSILEAMAIGLPIVATNWCGPTYIVDDNCGFLVDPTSTEGFIEGLATAMIQLAQSPELRASMSQASKEKVKTNNFDWDSKIDRILDIFSEIRATKGDKD